MNQSKRIFYFDVLRALAIIGIVFCHAAMPFVISGIHTSEFYVSAFFDCLRDFSIPVFVMLSGALLIGKKDSFNDFFKKRLSRIFIPFFFWVIVYIIYSSACITHGFSLSNAIDIFFGTSGTFGVTFWFIWMIIIAYFGIFLINKCMNRFENPNKFMNALALVALAYILICDFSSFNPLASRIVYFISFLAYVVIGYVITHNDWLESRFDSRILLLIASVLAIVSYCSYIFNFVVPRSVSAGQFIYLSYFNVTILFISLMVFLSFKFLSSGGYLEKIEHNALGNAIALISKYSFGIYLVHYLILHALKMNVVKFVNYLGQSPLIWIPVFVVLAAVISLVILMILDKIPYLRKVTGNN